MHNTSLKFKTCAAFQALVTLVVVAALEKFITSLTGIISVDARKK